MQAKKKERIWKYIGQSQKHEINAKISWRECSNLCYSAATHKHHFIINMLQITRLDNIFPSKRVNIKQLQKELDQLNQIQKLKNSLIFTQKQAFS